MQLIVQRGLPTRPQAGTAPQSVVNTVNQAAQRSDTSDKPAKQEVGGKEIGLSREAARTGPERLKEI